MTAPSPGTGAEPVPPDAEELGREIERTREQLGETVAALAAKADVKALAREKASQLSGRVKGTGAAAAQRVAAVSGRVKGSAARRATAISGRVKGTAAPRAQRVASAARRRPVPVAAAATAAALAILATIRWRRRRG